MVKLLLSLCMVVSMVVCTSLVCEKQSIPPTVKTKYATEITATRARLNGDLITIGTASQVKLSFEWGTRSADYTNKPTVPATTVPGPIYFDLSGLEPDTTYYFRAIAVGDGTSYGAERSFKTSPLP